MSSRNDDRKVRARIEESRRWFRDHHARVEPDAAFAARVTLRLGAERRVDLGWAAARLLPASIAIALVLAWATTRGVAVRQELTRSSSETDVLAWVLSDTEGRR